MARRRAKTWAELVVQRVGFRRSARVMQFVVTWALAENDLGHRPTVEEYADWWGDVSYATAYRDQALFREALPWFDTPSGFLAVVGSTNLGQPVPARYLREVPT